MFTGKCALGPYDSNVKFSINVKDIHSFLPIFRENFCFVILFGNIYVFIAVFIYNSQF